MRLTLDDYNGRRSGVSDLLITLLGFESRRAMSRR